MKLPTTRDMYAERLLDFREGEDREPTREERLEMFSSAKNEQCSMQEAYLEWPRKGDS